MNCIDKLVQIAKSRVGIKESPPNSNTVDCNTWYYGRKVCGGFPWCVVEIQYVFHLAGLSNLLLRTASSSALYKWFKSQGRIYKTPQVGDIAFYKFSNDPDVIAEHVGFVVENVDAKHFKDVEGNTSAKGSQSDGGEVMLKTRAISGYVVGFGRPNYGNVTATTTTTTSTTPATTPSTANTSVSYKKGTVYTLQANMFVRVTAGGEKKRLSELTKDGKSHSYDDGTGHAIMKKGTRVTCLGVQTKGNQIWLQIPSGWVCAKQGDKVYAL